MVLNQRPQSTDLNVSEAVWGKLKHHPNTTWAVYFGSVSRTNAPEWCNRKASSSLGVRKFESQRYQKSREQNWPCSRGGRYCMFSLSPVNHSSTSRWWVSVSTCMWQRVDSTFLWVCYPAEMSLGGTFRQASLKLIRAILLFFTIVTCCTSVDMLHWPSTSAKQASIVSQITYLCLILASYWILASFPLTVSV